MDCRECKGRGVVLIDCDHGDVAGDSCSACVGQGGKIENECEYCDGYGEVSNCEDCDGDGCDTCDYNGVVPARPEASLQDPPVAPDEGVEMEERGLSSRGDRSERRCVGCDWPLTGDSVLTPAWADGDNKYGYITCSRCGSRENIFE